ncbi:hypothetical protein J6590_062793 [Homalodisca vitripennis]|nr:hypothetical protein J6590_062793 [Homalodisca vitripennis]
MNKHLYRLRPGPGPSTTVTATDSFEILWTNTNWNSEQSKSDTSGEPLSENQNHMLCLERDFETASTAAVAGSLERLNN